MNTTARIAGCLLKGVACILLIATIQLCPAAVLITVDITDPTAVVFSSNGGFAEVNDNSANLREGVTFINLFTSSVLGSGTATASSLTPGLSPSEFYSNYANGFASLNREDLNIYVDYQFFGIQAFVTAFRAFTGSMTVDLSWATFHSVGTTGNIIVGNTELGSGATIGQWEIVSVPEPSTTAFILLAGAVGGVTYWRRITAKA